MTLSKESFAPSNPLPENLRALYPLAQNMHWVWNRKIRRVFEKIDPAAWKGLGENPVALLQHLTQSQISELSNNSQFLAILKEAEEIQGKYIHERTNTWFHRRFGILKRDYLVAYFSAEFGITSCLRTYSGGLGILSADHLKAASDLGIPVVGIGLFYRRGYFVQGLAPDGWQTESYPENDPSQLPIELVTVLGSSDPLIISVPIERRLIRVRAWNVSVGRTHLYLLDSNLSGLNSKEDCDITSELYGGDSETRIEQEIILGFGGAKLLRALGLRPSLFHMNEGHSAFVTLARILEIVEEENGGADFYSAKQRVRQGNLFTTHTPVPAGIDCFPRDMIERYFEGYCRKVGTTVDELFTLGLESPDSTLFNMAVFALGHSKNVNAVSKLHGIVAGKSWKHLLINEHVRSDMVDVEDIFQLENGQDSKFELGSITNGIHIPSWISDSMADLYDDYLGQGWEKEIDDSIWTKVQGIPDRVLWGAKCRERTVLINFIREYSEFSGVLDPDALTIGFARRFATYKRATLVLQDRERLAKLLNESKKPVQIIFAGKAHPKDTEGKKLIQEIISFAKSEPAGGKVVFLRDYDIAIARSMVRGVDVWLNNPRRPLEASGTSGMKVLANGGLNLSILDGWWDEAYQPSNGWAIGVRDDVSDSALSDSRDAESLYGLLEKEIIPEFYDRDPDGIPTKWVTRMKNSISTLSSRFNTARMLKEYSQRYYFNEGDIAGERLNRSELGVDLLDEISGDR